jgi:hypothetical protein
MFTEIRKSVLVSLAAGSLLACSSDPEPAPAQTSDTQHCTEDLVGVVDPTLLIDDMEDTDPTIAAVGDRNGTWWLATDMTGGTTTPPGDQAAAPERIPGGRCGSHYGVRITGEGFTEWGASLVGNFRLADDLEPIDASAYRGVMFWGRVGESNTSPLRVQFQDGYTYPQGGVCVDDPDAADGCFNGFGTAVVPIDTEWRLYKLEFSRMGQRDFGLRRDALDLTELYAIEFGVVKDTVFDFWVDDIWFYE